MYNTWGNSWGASSSWGTSWGANPVTSSGSDLINRWIPIDWIPRWMDPNYDKDSTLRKLYFLGIVYWANEMERQLHDNLVPQFFGEIGGDRQAWIVQYHYPKNYIPHVVLVTNSSSSLAFKDSVGSLLYEKKLPVYCRDDNYLYFKNLDSVCVSVTSVTGILTYAALASSIVEDSQIIVENEWGDCFYFDQYDQRVNLASGTIDIGYEGTFRVWYKSLNSFNKLSNGQYYITIDDERYRISPYYFKNTWDEYAALKNITRRDTESNLHLKARCHYRSLSKRIEEKISASLGQCQIIMWNTQDTLSLSGSGNQSFNFLDFNGSFYVEETPIKDGANFLLSYVPSGYVQLFLNGRKLETDTYSVSGSRIVPSTLNTNLLNATEGALKVTYKHVIYDTSSRTTSSLEAIDEIKKPVVGIISKKVRVSNTQKKIDIWRWNQELGKLTGLAGFDF